MCVILWLKIWFLTCFVSLNDAAFGNDTVAPDHVLGSNAAMSLCQCSLCGMFAESTRDKLQTPLLLDDAVAAA